MQIDRRTNSGAAGGRYRNRANPLLVWAPFLVQPMRPPQLGRRFEMPLFIFAANIASIVFTVFMLFLLVELRRQRRNQYGAFVEIPRGCIIAISRRGDSIRYISRIEGYEVDQLTELVKRTEDILPEDREPYETVFGWNIEKVLFTYLSWRFVSWHGGELLTFKDHKGRSCWALPATLDRSFHLNGLLTLDNYRIELELDCHFRVMQPGPIFCNFASNYHTKVDSIAKAHICETVARSTWDDLKTGARERLDTLSFAAQLRTVGLSVEMILIKKFDIDSTSADLRKAVEMDAIAQEKSKASRRSAYAERLRRTLEGQGDAASTTANSRAALKRFEELIAVFSRNGFSERESAEKALELVSKEKQWDNIGQLKTLVLGRNEDMR